MEKSGFFNPDDNEAEKASNSYLMSLIAVMAGMPLPIINLLATFFFFLGNRKSTPFVRWHCMQPLLSQLFLMPFNSIGFWWTLHIAFGDASLTNKYFAYILLLLLLNLSEFIVTIYTAIQVRKGKHITWCFFGPLTDLILKVK